MPYEISYDQQDNMVKIHFSCDDAKQEHYLALEEACELCSKHHCKKLLIDLRELKKEITSRKEIGCFDFGESVAMKMFGFKIAHVLPKVASEMRDIEFISTVESNRGVNSQEFFTVEDALKWLK
jgi:hypothetical protein